MKHAFYSLGFAAVLSSAIGCSSEAVDGDGPQPGFGLEEKPSAAPAASAAESAKPKPPSTRRVGFAFIHGTGDVGNTDSLACSSPSGDFRCEVPQASETYWTRANIDISRADSSGTKRPYVAIGCPFGSRTPWLNTQPVKGGGATPGTADCAAAQIRKFLAGPDGAEDTSDDITDLFVVTHSGGSNVMRYMLQQHAASKDFSRVHAASRRVLTLAPPTNGTYLANWVFTRGTLGNVAQKLAAALGGDLYDGDGTFFIQTSLMDLFNKDAARFGGVKKDVAGVPFHVAAGTYPHAQLGLEAAKCGGYGQTLGLQFLHETYLQASDAGTYRDGCSDGFITCTSAMSLAQGDASRILFGRAPNGSLIGKTLQRAHNQSKNDCDGIGTEVRNFFNSVGMSTMKGFVTSTRGTLGTLGVAQDSSGSVLRSREWYARTDDRAARASLGHWAAGQRLSVYDPWRQAMRAASVEEVRGLEGRAAIAEVREPESDEELVAERTMETYDVTETAVVGVKLEKAGVAQAHTQLTAHAFMGSQEIPVEIEERQSGAAIHVRAPAGAEDAIVWVRIGAARESEAHVTQRTLDVPVRFTRRDATIAAFDGSAVAIDAARAGSYGIHAIWIDGESRAAVQAQANLGAGRGKIALALPHASKGHLEQITLVRHDTATTQHALARISAR